tara:strand:+ start:1093 stop:1662 length:570 start_codon:yes stop_codon:yes gene_type:complete
MKINLQFKSSIRFVWVLLLVPLYTEAQCEVLKSELESVKNYMTDVSHAADSLQTFAEAAAFATQFNMARTNARKVEILIGQALTAASEAVSMASEAQYYSEVCNIDDVKSFSIDTESLTTDTRDHTEEAYENAKKANTAKNLGDLHYYMRKSQAATKEARKSAEAAAYAASDAYYSCTHGDGHEMNSNK